LKQIEKVSIKEKNFEKEFPDRMQVRGKLRMKILLRNDSYKGFDKSVMVEFFVFSEAKDRAEV
jgi:hypothetical protein